MDKERHLVFFSGGIDSTTLLQYLLKKPDLEIYVCSFLLGYAPSLIDQNKTQIQAIEDILKLYKRKGYQFKELKGVIKFDFLGEFDTDEIPYLKNDHWLYFFAGMICKRYGIPNFWTAHNSFTDHFREAELGSDCFWLKNGETDRYIKLGYDMELFDKPLIELNDIKIRNPQNTGIEIDKFTPLEMYKYIDPEIRPLVKSCTNAHTHRCKETPYCYKCHRDIQTEVANTKGELLIK